jgi:sugar/nucleoside kinase (ribokinase family)
MLQVCIVGGYFSGAQDKFMSGLATHMLEEKGVLGAASCSSAWRNAYDVGVSFSKSGKIANSSEAEVVKHAAEFSAKVYSSVAKGMTP